MSFDTLLTFTSTLWVWYDNKVVIQFMFWSVYLHPYVNICSSFRTSFWLRFVLTAITCRWEKNMNKKTCFARITLSDWYNIHTISINLIAFVRKGNVLWAPIIYICPTEENIILGQEQAVHVLFCTLFDVVILYRTPYHITWTLSD